VIRSIGKLITALVNSGRSYLAYWLVLGANKIVPHYQKAKEPVPMQPDVEVRGKTPLVHLRSVVRFTDMASYMKAIKDPQDTNSACMLICNDLKRLSALKKAPVRFFFSINSYYDKTGETKVTTSASIGVFGKGRWYKTSDLAFGPEGLPVILREMIESMAQDGWGCMEDSIDQVRTYFSDCMEKNRQYVSRRARLFGQGRIRGQISLVLNVNDDVNRSDLPQPMIMHRVSVWNGGARPIESAHQIFFHQHQPLTEKA
jgi:hypothetical protein